MQMRGSSVYATLSQQVLNKTLDRSAFGLHINVNIEPQFAVSYGSVRSHSYTSGGVYQNWGGIEPNAKNSRTWTALDNWVNTHFDAGRKIILDLSGTPNWAVAAGAVGGSPYPNNKGNMAPDSWSDYTDFVTAAATRYAGKIFAYDGWNEPNVPDVASGQKKYYAGANATAAYLAQGQRLLYQAVKAADPAARVLSPSFSSVFSGVDGAASGAVGLKQFLSASDGAGGFGAQWFDDCSFHLYNNDLALNTFGLVRMNRGVRAALDAAGRPDARIIAGETGVIVPGLQTLTLQQQLGLIDIHMVTLAALDVPHQLWFSVDDATIGWGAGASRQALADRWSLRVSQLTSAPLGECVVRMIGQNTLEATAAGITVAWSGMTL